MTPVVAVIAPGLMGAAVGKRLVDNGLRVLTSLRGRSNETAARAKAAGMTVASDEEIASVDFILSILPPGDALTLAERFVPSLTAGSTKPVYVDCNAINPKTLERIAAAIAPTECPFVDAGIIGPPPANPPTQRCEGKAGTSGPRFYASGAAAPQLAILRDYGLDVRILNGALGAASALKMSHAGIAKGVTAIGAAMILAATRAGSADELFKELQSSQADMLVWFKRQLPHMPPRAYRWVAEMHEIAGFVGDDPAARELYESAAHFYQRIAEDFAADKKDVCTFTAFLGKGSS
jgi:3-hydroxyisobutyrate dehydrogenase-like beta-hydroxyacid dehydrogenase